MWLHSLEFIKVAFSVHHHKHEQLFRDCKRREIEGQRQSMKSSVDAKIWNVINKKNFAHKLLKFKMLIL
jgi:hypothetical protein